MDGDVGGADGVHEQGAQPLHGEDALGNDRPAQQAAQVGEVGHALLRAGQTEPQFQCRVDGHEDAGWQWDGRDQQHDPLVREDQGIGQQDAEDAGRGANDRGTVGGQEVTDQYLGNGTEDDGRQIGDGRAAWPPDHLDA